MTKSFDYAALRLSREGDDQFPPDVPVAHSPHRLAELRQVVAVLDDGRDLPRLDELAQRLEVAAVRLRDEEHGAAAPDLRRELDAGDVAERPEHALAPRSADQHDRAGGVEDAAHGRPRAVAGVVEEHVVALSAAREVLARVVEDALGTECACLLDVR